MMTFASTPRETIQSHEGYELTVCDAHHDQWLAGRWIQDFYLDDGLDQ